MRDLLIRAARGGGTNFVIRAATLFFRFGLSFYVISFLGLEAAGIYGLAVGAIGIVPAALGWGLNYFLSREVVGMTPDEAAPLIRSRLKVTFISLALTTLAAVPLLFFKADALMTTYLLVLLLLWLETFALDVYMPMIGLEMGVQANVLVFVRSALWIPAVVALGMIVPAFRTLEWVFGAWIVSHVLAIGLLVLFVRRWPVAEALRTSGPQRWARDRLRRSWYIYLSDLGLVGLVYIDRFIVNDVLGLSATGIYSFYWSITNALQTLVATAVVQLALPRMVRAFREDPGTVWQAELRTQFVRTLVFASVLALTIFVATEAIIRLSPPGRFPRAELLLLLLLLSAVVRSCSDLLNLGITSTGRDHVYSITNVAGIFLTVALSLLFLSLFGLIGAGISSLATAFSLLMARGMYIRHLLTRQKTAGLKVQDRR